MAKVLSIVDVKLHGCALYITLMSKSNLRSFSKMQNCLPSESPRNPLAIHKTASNQHPKSHSSTISKSIKINQSNQMQIQIGPLNSQPKSHPTSKKSQGTLLPR